MRGRWLNGWTSLLTVLLCGTATATFSAPAAGPDPAPITSSDELYQLENLLKIELFMKPETWDQVRFSWRGQDGKKVDGRWVTTESDYEHQSGGCRHQWCPG